MIEYEGHTLPIEVKSGKDYTVHSALNNVLGNPEYEIGEAFVFANCNVQRTEKTTYLPVYMAAFLNKNSADEFIMERVSF